MNLFPIGPLALAVALGTGAYLGGPAAAQQLQYACDQNSDRFIDASESRACMERAFEELASVQQAVTEEQLSATSQGERGLIFAEVDQDKNGEISREEWTNWYEQRFSAATRASQSGMPVADYESREWVAEGYTRPLPEEAGEEQK